MSRQWAYESVSSCLRKISLNWGTELTDMLAYNPLIVFPSSSPLRTVIVYIEVECLSEEVLLTVVSLLARHETRR